MNEDPRPRRATDGIDWAASAVPRETVPEGGTPAPAAPPPRASTRSRFAVPLTATLAGLLGAIVGGAMVTRLSGDDDTPAPADPGVRELVSVELSSAIADTAAKGRLGVVKLISTRTSGGTTESDVGSGVVVDASGHVVTNAHVVLGTETLKVVLPDGSERPAVLVGHDYPFTDIAVVLIGPGGATPLAVGDSRTLAPGQTVVAIGNPLAEFTASVTTGVISGVDRVRVFDAYRYTNLIQTDAALNSGNSGGALLNLRGEFIGMPTAVLRETRNRAGVEGIGFALPSELVMSVAKGIIEASGAYPRPALGIEHTDLAPEIAVRLGRRADLKGAFVSSIEPAGPAATAGIQQGDVITSIGGTELSRDEPLLNALAKYEPGASVKVVLNRNGRIIETEVRLGRKS